MNGTRRRCEHEAEESAQDKRCTFPIHARLLDAAEPEIICASDHRMITRKYARQLGFQSSEIKI